MKLAIVGGGGFRVPLVYGALLRRRDSLRFDEIVLHDVDERGSSASARCSTGQARRARRRGSPFRATTDLDDAVEGADFVFCAIRVGGLEGRAVDEPIPLGARRARPGDDRPRRHLLRAAHDPGDGRARGARRAARAATPGSINFTNPAGMVTEALQQVLGDRAIGICDSPVRPLPPRRRARSGRARTSCGSTTSASTTSAGCAPCATAAATCCRSCWPTTSARRLRGGPRCSAPSGCTRSG